MLPARINVLILLAVVTLGVASLARAADEVVLATLAPAAADAQPVEIRAAAAVTPSPLAGKAHTTWLLQPGEALTRERQPADRLIEFYTGNINSPTLLCRVWVRYYAQKSGWVPEFQLIEEPAVASTSRGWKPVMLPQGTALLIAQTGGVLPNAEGFKRSLEFGLAAGAMSIDAWRVR